MYTATRKSKGLWNLDQPHLTPVSRHDHHVVRPCLLTESHVLCSNRMRACFLYVASCDVLCCIPETARINDDDDVLRPPESLCPPTAVAYVCLKCQFYDSDATYQRMPME